VEAKSEPSVRPLHLLRRRARLQAQRAVVPVDRPLAPLPLRLLLLATSVPILVAGMGLALLPLLLLLLLLIPRGLLLLPLVVLVVPPLLLLALGEWLELRRTAAHAAALSAEPRPGAGQSSGIRQPSAAWATQV